MSWWNLTGTCKYKSPQVGRVFLLNKEPDADQGKCRNCCLLQAQVGNQASRDP